MHILLAAVAAQAAGMISNSEAPEPVIIAVQPVPPNAIDAGRIVTASRIARPMVPSGEVVPIRVRVTAGDRLLLSDVMRVARNAGANHHQSRTEAGQAICTQQGSYGSGQRHSLSVNLSWQEHLPLGPAVRVEVNWQRPSDTADPCAGEGSRTVALSQTVPLAPGESRSIRGDGGLAVTVSRP